MNWKIEQQYKPSASDLTPARKEVTLVLATQKLEPHIYRAGDVRREMEKGKPFKMESPFCFYWFSPKADNTNLTLAPEAT